MDDHGPRPTGPQPAERQEALGSGAWQPRWGLLALALAIVVGTVVYASYFDSAPASDSVAAAGPQSLPPYKTEERSTPAPPLATAAASQVAVASPAVPPSAATSASLPPQIPRLRDPNGDTTPDIADFVNPGERPTMKEVIERLNQAGVQGGLGAFSPPGTRPPRIGLAVPEEFVLPPGYVRHYQATDDGQRIEPILMFSPDHAFFDAAGRPVEVPADRVVPPELAPPGLPLRRIALPAPLESARPGR